MATKTSGAATETSAVSRRLAWAGVICAIVASIVAIVAFSLPLNASKSDVYELDEGMVAQCGDVMGVLLYGVHTDGTGYPWLGGDDLETDRAWEESCGEAVVAPAVVGFTGAALVIVGIAVAIVGGMRSASPRRTRRLS